MEKGNVIDNNNMKNSWSNYFGMSGLVEKRPYIKEYTKKDGSKGKKVYITLCQFFHFTEDKQQLTRIMFTIQSYNKEVIAKAKALNYKAVCIAKGKIDVRFDRNTNKPYIILNASEFYVEEEINENFVNEEDIDKLEGFKEEEKETETPVDDDLSDLPF